MKTLVVSLLLILTSCTTLQTARAVRDLRPIATVDNHHKKDVQQKKQCEYGDANSCKQGEYCIKVDHGVTACRAEEQAKFILGFPYAAKTEVICDQGVLSPKDESHTWLNTAFAVDLQSDRKVADVKIFAGASGEVIVHVGCTTESDKCGGGFGNSVKILTDDGYLVQYAHLKKVFVKSGDRVREGQLVGTEGTTGWTGVGNRHLHLSVHFDWRLKADLWKNPGYLPPSVPFKLLVCEPGCADGCKRTEVDVRDLVCRRTSKTAPPLCASL